MRQSLTLTITLGVMLAVSAGSLAVMTRQRNAAVADAEIARQEAKDATKRAAQAELAARQLEKVVAGKLTEIFPDLKRIEDGENVVGTGSLASFTISGQRVLAKLKNTTLDSYRPNVTVHLLDRNGFITGSAKFRWALETLSPRETRVDEAVFGQVFGRPVYYVVRTGEEW